MGIPELPVPDGLVLRPFRGVRFAVDDPALVTSPPYDLISDDDVQALLDSHPNNVVRLILPRTPPSLPPHPTPPSAPLSTPTTGDAPGDPTLPNTPGVPTASPPHTTGVPAGPRDATGDTTAKPGNPAAPAPYTNGDTATPHDNTSGDTVAQRHNLASQGPRTTDGPTTPHEPTGHITTQPANPAAPTPHTTDGPTGSTDATEHSAAQPHTSGDPAALPDATRGPTNPRNTTTSALPAETPGTGLATSAAVPTSSGPHSSTTSAPNSASTTAAHTPPTGTPDSSAHPSNIPTTAEQPYAYPGDATSHRTARYEAARDALRAWLSEGVLVRDELPALYVYEQSAPGMLQRGLIGDVGLAAPEQRIILPHENVMPGPVADRLALMGTTQANLEPILLLYNGNDPSPNPQGHPATSPDRDATPSGYQRSPSPGTSALGSAARQGRASRLVDEVASSRPPLVTANTGDGVRHRLWAITDQAEIDAVNTDLRPRQALIADGHHRYATYRELQRQEHARRTLAPDTTTGPRHAEPTPAQTDATVPNPAADSLPSDPASGPWDFGLALLVDSDAYPPMLKAIHRVIPGLPLEEAAARAKGAWRVQDFAELSDGLAALEAAGEPAFLLAGAGACHLLTDPDAVQLAHGMPTEHSKQWNALNTSVLTEFVLPKVWNMRDDERSVRIVHHDAQAAADLAATTGGTAVILNALAVDDVLAVAAGGERVPRKSTSFGPKPRTGLVLRTFDIE